MKVCIISGYPPNVGRGAESTSMLVKSLASQNSEIVVLGNTAPDKAMEEKVENVTLRRVWTPNSFKGIFNLFKAVVSANPDVVHVIYGYLYYGKPIFSAIFIMSLLSALRMLRRPVIVTIHQVFSPAEISNGSLSIFATGLPMTFTKIGFQFVNRILGCLSSKVIVVHKEHATILARDYGLKNVVYIPISLSHDHTIAKDEAKSKLGLEKKKPILVFGFLAPYKGVEYAISAMPTILKEIPNAVMVVAGTAVPSLSHRKETVDYIFGLKKLVKDLGMENNIVMKNEYIPGEDVPLYFGSCDVIILPNTQQTGPSEVWRLASIFGIPNIASDIEYFRKDIVNGETGILVPAADSDGIAKASIGLLENECLRQRIIGNLRSVSETYKAANIAQKHEKLYQSVLG